MQSRNNIKGVLDIFQPQPTQVFLSLPWMKDGFVIRHQAVLLGEYANKVMTTVFSDGRGIVHID